MDVEAEQPLAAPDQPHALRGARPDRHQGLRRRPRHAAAAGRARSRRPSPTCPASRRRSSSRSSTVDELHIRLRPDDLAFHGLSRDVRRPSSCRPPCRARWCRRCWRGSGGSTCVVRLDEPYRTDLPKLGQLRHRPARRPAARCCSGSWPTSATALGPNAVNRENVRRRIVDPLQRRRAATWPSAVADIQQRVDETREPTCREGYFVEYGGQFESQQRATRLIAVAGGACRSSACSSCC